MSVISKVLTLHTPADHSGPGIGIVISIIQRSI